MAPARLNDPFSRSVGLRGIRKYTMYTIYVIKSKDGKLYKGMTKDLGRRFKEHLSGRTKTTRKMSDITIAYTENFTNFEEARKRELYFKSATGRRFLKKILNI